MGDSSEVGPLCGVAHPRAGLRYYCTLPADHGGIHHEMSDSSWAYVVRWAMKGDRRAS